MSVGLLALVMEAKHSSSQANVVLVICHNTRHNWRRGKRTVEPGRRELPSAPSYRSPGSCHPLGCLCWSETSVATECVFHR